ncbi:DNA-binding NarL/FixJ family response regulator [Agromyces terreus]|uniref:DNA-binding NarL/FixJ family response regulator n=1 Tax=Agromyces terreus TaxID=424795 RepID=A0A9X2KB88_9MICO|nr:response regulator transcription factor [Agromyces terreus]MCP2369910.1 DNA-binding NarL/FixJ family response regulator [Agromyces terreus]
MAEASARPTHDGAVRVVIVDDHSIFRSGLKADLDASIEVVGEAHDVESAVQAVTDAAPDVVLLDVHLPGVGVPAGTSGGAEVIRRAAAALRQAQDGAVPATRFLALSVSDRAEDVVGVIRAGARGYITKGSSGADVSRAVHAVASGDAVFSPKLAGFVLDAFGAAGGETAAASDELDRLSAREQEVMRLIARGYAYKEVAAELFISTKTVETHVSAVLRKLQLSSRHELTAWANARRLL